MVARARTTGRALAAAVVAAVIGAGCATGEGMRVADSQARTVTVLVDNNNWQDATIYVVGLGPRVRLGTVTSMTTARFALPRALQRPDGLQLEADLIGSNARKVTNRIIVNAGEPPGAVELLGLVAREAGRAGRPALGAVGLLVPRSAPYLPPLT